MNRQQQLWSDVDAYFNERFVGADAALEATLESSHAAGLPAIQISASQGKFLMLLARSIGAQRILEIGTLGGYSSIWLARALPPGGLLVSCEKSASHAQVARANLQRAGLGDRTQIRVGLALHTLSQLASERAAPFDLVFIDADKAGYPDYLTAALQLSHVGTLIVADNVVREGEVLEAHSADEDVRGIRRFIDMLAADPRLSAVALQSVGERGHDGMAIARVDVGH